MPACNARILLVSANEEICFQIGRGAVTLLPVGGDFQLSNAPRTVNRGEE